ncbi:23S rRNA (uracil(1939)-C(5))-methyltransferase RlmD [Pontibacterium sp.]|uniref:23S rRNA (uracil(1939)-C(5))-methyltransferase RlmD n=1 Tax=Pontibacterium sp. TaxID=2036026 RepID=UPI003513125F
MRKRSTSHRHTARRKKPAQPVHSTPIELTIEGLSHEGRGIARHEGKTIFVSGALSGESVEARITKNHKRYAEAECIQVTQASPFRSEPVCPHYGVCGGCDLQHLEHTQQIEEKQAIVLDQLQRLGKVQPEQIESPLRSQPENYRRAARLGINQLQRDGSVVIGFRRRGSNKLTSIDHCPVLNEKLNQVISLLHESLQDVENVRNITHAEVVMGDSEGALTLRTKKRLPDELISTLTAAVEAIQLKLYLDDGEQVQPAVEPAQLKYALPEHNISLNFEPGDFLQVNAALNAQMIQRAIDWLELQKDDRVLDLFSGIGNFTLPLARYAGEVVGVEGSDTMVQRATKNARRNQLDNTAFYKGDLSGDLRHHHWYNQGFNKVLLDPPRTGALEAIKQLQHYDADRILYVSCNPAALARDAAELASQGYRFTRFCVMDMFPHTSHVESLALFEKPIK